MKQVVSLSGGKDSTAMLLMMLERGEQVDEAVMFDGGWEFPEMHEHLEKLRHEVDVPITILKPPHPLEWYMNHYQLKKGSRRGEHGYGFARPNARWCTRIKSETISRYLCGGELVCVGIAADEDRMMKDGNRYPLVEWGVTEADALAYCKARGFDWGGLYDYLDRVSCWCCPLKSMDELRAIRRLHPELWQKLLDMERRCAGWPDTFQIASSAQQLEERFAKEDAQIRIEWQRVMSDVR